MDFRLTIAYDGGPFRGWARQDDQRTVQGEIEHALGVVLGPDPIALTVAGRTDGGVHALRQVASFDFGGEMPPDIVRSLNGLTPPEIAILAVEPAPGGFDARRDAISRTYCYRVNAARPPSPLARGRAWSVTRDLDRALLEEAARCLIGEHDFTAFTPTDTYHRRFERVVEAASWRDEGTFFRPDGDRPAGADFLQFWITADSFMRNMVRILVGTMVEVADGSRSIEDFRRLLDGADRSDAGQTAPPEGLYLVEVGYRPPS
jgi:tRNA pseudouridine38-40 synthase